MTREYIESKLLLFLQQKIIITNSEDKPIKTGKLTLVNIHEYTIQFIFSKSAGGNFTYEIPYPYSIKLNDGVLILDYTLTTLSKGNEILPYKFAINKPRKKNKFYDVTLKIRTI